MKIDKYFIDTNIPMYAAGKAHEHKEECINVLGKVAEGALTAFTDTEVFQEILYRFIEQLNLKTGYQIYDDFLKLMHGNILPITVREIKELRRLSEKYPQSKSGDLIHLSAMLTNNINKIITLGKDFKRFEEAEVVHPKTFTYDN